MSNMTITKSIFIKAPAAHVWTFLTDANKLAEWFHRGIGNFEGTGEWALLTNSHGSEGNKLCWGEVLEFTPHTRFVHTFTHGGLKDVETTCTWTLAEVEGGTIVNLVHEGWEKVGEAAFGMASNHDKGWDEHLTRFRKVAG